MDIMQSPLGNEINAVFNAGPSASIYYYRAEIKANGQTFQTLKVISMDRLQDFETKFADEIVLRVAMGKGMYTYRIFPYLSDLQITLYRTQLFETAGDANQNVPQDVQIYRATLRDPIAPAIEANSGNQPSERLLDTQGFLELDFTLQDPALEQLRMLITGGNYRRCLVEDVIKNVMTRESVAVDVDGTQVPVGVDMYPADNQEQREHVVLPHGLRLVDVPGYIHKHCGGVYSTGLASYFLDSIWHIFPTYDNTRFDQELNTLTVIRVPAKRMPGVQRTYMQQGSMVKILATGDSLTENRSESQIFNQGNGVRFVDGDKIMHDFVQIEDNKAVASRGLNNNEFTTIERETGFNNVQMSPRRITSNPFLEYSEMAKRDGSYVQLVWENSNPDLLVPGMQVKILYLENDTISETYGILIKAHHYVQMATPGVTSSRHVTNSSLMLFTKRQMQLSGA